MARSILFSLALLPLFLFGQANANVIVDRAISANVLVSDGIHICSGAVVSIERHLVLTAAHCVEGDVAKLTVNGKRVPVIDIDWGHDIAILHVPDANFLIEAKVSSTPVHLGDILIFAGNPLGNLDWVGFGRVAKIKDHVRFPGSGHIFEFEAIGVSVTGVCEGSSGGAAYNEAGEIVGTVSAGGPESCGPLMDLSPIENALELIKYSIWNQ